MSFNDPEHHDRVVRLRQQLLDLLAGAEDDPNIFPGGLPEDPVERTAMISLLNADALGGVLAATYLGLRNHYSERHAEQWLAEVLQVFRKTVNREVGREELDFQRLAHIAEALWSFRDEVPDVLPEDFDGGIS